MLNSIYSILWFKEISMDDIQRYNFWHLETNHFAKNLWEKVNECFNNNQEETGLILLFEGLLDEKSNPNNCNLFLAHIMNHELSSDVIVHVLNALAPIRDTLSNWEVFVKQSTISLEKEMPHNEVKFLLQVII